MYVIFGGCGFIGTRLCKRLNDSGKDFLILDARKGKTFPKKTREVDVTDSATLSDIKCEASALVNLAAVHRDDVRPRSLYDDVNVSGAKNTCSFAQENDIDTIVFTSSVAVYGFAEKGTSEQGDIAPFNDYGRTKAEAEAIYKQWQRDDSAQRSLVIIRPTVVFGEGNRGNVYNLFRQIAAGAFLMIGTGKNRKSMAYVENVAAFIEHIADSQPGIHVYNYIDKPDSDMNSLVANIKEKLGKKPGHMLRIPYFFGLTAGTILDFVALVTGRKFPISAIRVKKFCSDSVYETRVSDTDFVPPVSLDDAIAKTIEYEFLEDHDDEVFFTE